MGGPSAECGLIPAFSLVDAFDNELIILKVHRRYADAQVRFGRNFKK